MSVIDKYISNQSSTIQPICQRVHETIKSALPDAEEQIKYGMPTYFFQQNVIHFAANKNHLGIYPTPSAINAFIGRLKNYKYSKGAIQFPYDNVDYDLIFDLAQYRLDEIRNKK